jgi:ParB-like chromosome segregation protein Spo0J
MDFATLKIEILRLDFQPSENLIEETVQDMVSAIRRGELLSPIIVRFDGQNYFVQDGFHRVEAYRRLGTREIQAEVIPGTLAQMEDEFRVMLEAIKRGLA